MKISGQLSCILLLLISINMCFSQEWVARYNGPSDSIDYAVALAVDGVGNTYVTGSSYGVGPFPDYDYTTVKYDSAGVEQWVVRYNGSGYSDDLATAIALDNAANVYVTGQSWGTGTGYDYATVKYDSAGVEQWVARYNGSGYNDDQASTVVVDDAGNVYVTGRSWDSGTGYDYATMKYNSAGVEQWVARYNGLGNDYDWAMAIAVDIMDNVCVTGKSWGTGTGYDYATVKYDSAGVEQWVVRYNGPGNEDDWATALAVDGATNVYVTGSSLGAGTYYDYTTMKYNSAGVEQWVVRYNGPGNLGDFAGEIAIDGVANIYVTGNSDGSGTNGDYGTVKYDSAGVEQWVAIYCPSAADDWATASTVDSEGSVYVTGAGYDSVTNYDYTTVRYDTAGVEQWVANYNGPGNDYDWANAIAIDKEGNVYVTGRSRGLGTGFDYATIKYSPTGIEERELIVKKEDKIAATILRGPLQLPGGKKCKVYDITGRVIELTKIQAGIYFIEVDGVVTQKVVKIR
jgi:hypothetical protein